MEISKNKEQTKRKLINAVGEILLRDGYAGLGVNRVAKYAGVNKKLIYRYFGSYNYLIESFIVENDFWLSLKDNLEQLLLSDQEPDIQKMVNLILKNQFHTFISKPELQQLTLSELSISDSLLKSINLAREMKSAQLFQLTDGHFDKGKVNFRAIAALLVGGIYYSILHVNANGGLFCDLDLTTEKDQKMLLRSAQQIVNWAFEKEKLSV